MCERRFASQLTVGNESDIFSKQNISPRKYHSTFPLQRLQYIFFETFAAVETPGAAYCASKLRNIYVTIYFSCAENPQKVFAHPSRGPSQGRQTPIINCYELPSICPDSCRRAPMYLSLNIPPRQLFCHLPLRLYEHCPVLHNRHTPEKAIPHRVGIRTAYKGTSVVFSRLLKLETYFNRKGTETTALTDMPVALKISLTCAPF